MSSLANPLAVKRIYQVDSHTLGIDWIDGHASRWRLATLRRRCPCAVCVDEWSGKPLLDPKQVDDAISAKHIESVGQYALRVHFSDGHNTGIYNFQYLRNIDETAGA